MWHFLLSSAQIYSHKIPECQCFWKMVEMFNLSSAHGLSRGKCCGINAFHVAGKCRRQVKKVTKFVKNVEIVEFHSWICNHREKCIQISINMPWIGSVIRDIVLEKEECWWYKTYYLFEKKTLTAQYHLAPGHWFLTRWKTLRFARIKQKITRITRLILHMFVPIVTYLSWSYKMVERNPINMNNKLDICKNIILVVVYKRLPHAMCWYLPRDRRTCRR